jgi:hypothetical protein
VGLQSDVMATSPISGFFAIRGHKSKPSNSKKFACKFSLLFIKKVYFSCLFLLLYVTFCPHVSYLLLATTVRHVRGYCTHTHTHHTLEKFRNTPAAFLRMEDTIFIFLFSTTFPSFLPSILHPLRLPFLQQSNSN